MLLYRANKYRLSPTPEQAEWFSQVAGSCRYVYNAALEQRRDHWRKGSISFFQQSAEMVACRAEFDFLRNCPAQSLNAALRDLDAAFQRFFLGISDCPKPRKKGCGDSFRIPNPTHVKFRRASRRMGFLKLPKIGWIKCRGWRALGGELRSVTISRRGGHWYASISWLAEKPAPSVSCLPPIGIDRGVTAFAALSNGAKIGPLNAFKRIEAKLIKLQRRLAQKKKFSANWKKQKAKITKLHSHAANARKDYLHKLSTTIAKSHGVVKIEALKINNMTASAKGTVENPGKNVKQKGGLSRAILDQGWGTFAELLRYKLTERGGELIEVPAAYTSQTCSCCGTIDRDSRKSQSIFECTACGHAENADVNAAKNILAARILAPKPPKRTLNKRVGKRNRVVPQGAMKGLELHVAL